MDQDGLTNDEQDAGATTAVPEQDVDELLIEEISIDGMCGVY